MGRYTAIHGISSYREVLIANAVRALRDSLPSRPRFAAFAERRAAVAAANAEGSWRAMAVAAAVENSALR